MFLLAGDRLDGVTPFAFGFIGFDAGAVRGVIGDVHRSTTASFGARQMFMLKGLNESMMGYTFLFGFHRPASFPEVSFSFKERHPGWSSSPSLMRGKCVGLTSAH